MPLGTNEWPYTLILERLVLALAIGLLVGLERQRRGKDAGVRTFGLAALLGAIGGLLGDVYALASLLLLGVLVIFLNLDTVRSNKGTELTTSLALVIVGVAGILSGQGHTLTPTALGVITVTLLAWKQPLRGFSHKLSESELRSALLLAILAFVIYPALPEGTIDPWHALEPRTAWVTVILIAGIGFVNYILLKVYGNRGVELAGFLGGLVNSKIAIRELAQRTHGSEGPATEVAFRGILLAVAAMLLRNAVLLAILAPRVLASAAVALGLMFATSVGLALLHGKLAPASPEGSEAPILNLQSPFSLKSALGFGAFLVIIQMASVLAQQALGQFGVYVTSLIGGFFSTASTVAAIAAIVGRGVITNEIAAICVVIASIASAAVDVPLILGLGGHKLITRLSWALGLVAVMGGVGALAQRALTPILFAG